MKWLLDLLAAIFGKKKEPTKPVVIEEEDNEFEPGSMTQIAIAYHKAEIEFPRLKAVTLAQWILESGRGTSKLSKNFNNYAGLKWRGDLGVEGAKAASYDAHDGNDMYVQLPSIEKFIEYYWKFIDRDVYDGWRDKANDPKAYITHLKNSGYAEDSNYINKVMNLIDDAEILLDKAVEQSEEDDRRDDNDEGDNEPPVIIADGAGELWYPDREEDSKVDGLKMRTRGRYRYGYPEGLVTHFTAGRSRNRADGGSRNPKTNRDAGITSVRRAVDKGSFAYFVIDRDGNIFQQFPLDRWGYHAGKSSWPTVSGTVSDHFVGVEILNAGKLEKTGNSYKAWFTSQSRGDKLFGDGEIRHSSGEANIAKGTYHAYSEAQEEALEKLVAWLYRNSPYKNNKKIFSVDNVVGHDEVSPGRKTDPGASLSMTMPELRSKIKEDLDID